MHTFPVPNLPTLRTNYVEKVGGQTKINGTVTDCDLKKDPYKVLYEDENTYFIDLDQAFLYLEALSRALSAMDATITKLSGGDKNDIGVIKLAPNTANVINMSGADYYNLSNKLSIEGVQAENVNYGGLSMKRASSTQSLIINLDLKGVSDYTIRQQMSYKFEDGTIFRCSRH